MLIELSEIFNHSFSMLILWLKQRTPNLLIYLLSQLNKCCSMLLCIIYTKVTLYQG